MDGHRRWRSSRHRRQLRSEAVEVGSDFGIGPVGVAYDFAANDTLTIDDVGFGPAVSAVELGDFLLGVADGVQIDMEAVQEPSVGGVIFVDADGENGEIRAIVVELHEGGRLLDTGRTLAPPEVQQDDFAAIVGEADGVFAVADGEVGGYAIGICRRCSAVAGRCEGEHQQRASSDDTRKPHVSIIRSGRYPKEGWAK